MKNEEIKIGIEEIQKIKMMANEKENILKSVLNFSVPEKKSIRSPYSFVSIFQRNHFAFYGALSIFVIFLGSGGLFLGSQKSLPGNTLYPIKVKVVEPLGSIVKLSPEKKAQYELALVKERIIETKELASQGKLDTEKQQQVNDLIKSHKVAFTEAISEIKQSEPSEEIVATTVNLEQQMKENVQTIALVTNENIENTTIENQEIAMNTKDEISIPTQNKETDIKQESQNTTDTITENQEIAQAPNNYQESTNTTMPTARVMAPMAITEDYNSQKYVDISLPLFTKWFEQMSTERGDVLDYSINDIVFVASKENMGEGENSYFNSKDSSDAFIVSVSYSVQTTEQGKKNYWLAGNGKDSENGWVLNKSVFITIDKENETYYIKNIGTGM